MLSKTFLSTAVCLLLCSLSAHGEGQNDFYFDNGIIPDLVTTPPPGIVTILYKGGVSVNRCNLIDPRKLRERPSFAWEFKEGVKYTLLMLDPDAPSRVFPVARSFVHLLVMNINENYVYNANTIFDYIGPNPFAGTGTHRYAFFVYEQSKNTTNVAPVERLPFVGQMRFSLNDFVRNHNLIGPIAGNCFLSKFSGGV